MKSFQTMFSGNGLQSMFTSIRMLRRVEINPWVTLDTITPAFKKLDAVMASSVHHEMLDDLVAALRAKNALHPHAFYPQGFGDTERLVQFGHDLAALSQPGVNTPAPIDVQLRGSSAGRDFASVVEGSFRTPIYEDMLPPQSHRASFQLVTPTCWYDGGSGSRTGKQTEVNAAVAETRRQMSALRPVVVLLAGTGEQGYQRRRHCVAYPLARLGIACLILESPLYGTRKPPYQRASKLATLTDLPLLGRVTIEEARCLVRWLRDQPAVPRPLAAAASGGSGRSLHNHSGGSTLGHSHTHSPRVSDQAAYNIAQAAVAAADTHLSDAGAGASSASRSSTSSSGSTNTSDGYGAIVLAGTSMGGLHAAMAASLLPYEVGVASWLGPASAAAVFTTGRLAFGTDYGALAADTDPANGDRWARIQHSVQQLEAIYAAAPHSDIPSMEATALLQRTFKGVPPHSLRAAHVAATQLLRITDLTNFPAPPRPDAAVFVIAGQDRYVPLDRSMKAMWRFVSEQSWRGCDVRTVRGGHVSGSLFALDTYASTVVEVIRKLVQK